MQDKKWYKNKLFNFTKIYIWHFS